jgi:hypothetical protein
LIPLTGDKKIIKMYRKPVKILKMYKMHHSNANIGRLYVKRKEGGRGL